MILVLRVVYEEQNFKDDFSGSGSLIQLDLYLKALSQW